MHKLKMYEEKKHSLNQVKHILAIAAGKGGVGKSSVTVNLAHALRHLNYSVGILDADIYGPSIRKMLPENRLPKQEGHTIIPALCHGIHMISMAYFRKEHEAAAVRAPIANSIISQFINQVQWGELDYLLIDFPPGTGDIQLTLSQQSNLTAAIMVTTPQEVAILDVRKAINLFEQVKVPILGIVENMSYFLHPATQEVIYIFGRGGGNTLAQEAGVPLLGTIPLEPGISLCGDNGKSIFDTENEAYKHTRDIFIEFANGIISHTEAIKKQTANGLEKVDLAWKELL